MFLDVIALLGREVRVYAIIPAAGRGTRMGTETPKQYSLLGGRPLLVSTLEVFERCALVQGVILVTAPSMEDFCKREIVEKFGICKVESIVHGGRERQESVYRGLKAIPEADIVAVHDAVRPLLPMKLLEESIKEAERWGAAAPAVRLTDTLKTVDGGEVSSGTVDRTLLRAVQTPQTFKYEILLEAMENAARDGFTGTDETSAVERAGYKVKLIEGSPLNIKVTTQDDMALAEAILKTDSSRGV